MLTPYGHLTYCTNIHPGESWDAHFLQLKENIPAVKAAVSPDQAFGIGLRLSDTASRELQSNENLSIFMEWLKTQDCYVFTINGFPFGGFHNTIVKDQVHSPDWTTADRVSYTVRLANILASLLPPGMEGGISTSPLSYRYWHSQQQTETAMQSSTSNILMVVVELIEISKKTGKRIHLDIEPEPDGLLQNGEEFFQWYEHYLVPNGRTFLANKFGFTETESDSAIHEHVQLCYDICHFAVGYENPEQVLMRAESSGIRIGKIQISAALKGSLRNEHQRADVFDAFRRFDEPTYLHQVVALKADGTHQYFADLPQALSASEDPSSVEWRAHFHVPLFVEDYGLLQSTQHDIHHVLQIQKEKPFSSHLEIETYTWDVLPPALKLPLLQSITREFQSVLDLFELSPAH